MGKILEKQNPRKNKLITGSTEHEGDRLNTVLCPCGSEKKYESCCEPLITGQAHATTPEALLRARYTAFTQANMSYLAATMTMELDEEENRACAENTQWLGLDILEVTDSTVEFSAYFILDGKERCVHERSVFIQKDGRWYYDGYEHQCDGHSAKEPIRVEKIGRNEPCPCGSGKKYKRCCYHA